MILHIRSDYKMFYEGIFYRTLRKTLSAFYHTLKMRSGSYPYVTGDSFRHLADHVYDETGIFDPALVKIGDIVFVGNPYMDKFFKEIHPKINNRYILIQHNGDLPVDEHVAKYIDDKIIKFYAQCVFIAHEKIIPIPIGIANKHHGIEISPELNVSALVKSSAKKPRIFYHFSIQTNPSERGPALEYFKSHSAMDTIEKFIPYRSYKKLLSSYCFTASPAGNALGSHRTWEALYLKTIPIVKRTVDAEYCASLGLPLWIVENWHELGKFSESELRIKYEEMMSSANFEAIFMDFWINKITADQKEARSQYHSI